MAIMKMTKLERACDADALTRDQVRQRNIELAFEFIHECIEDPSLLDEIPNGSHLVNIPHGEGDVVRHNEELAANLRVTGHEVIRVHWTHEE